MSKNCEGNQVTRTILLQSLRIRLDDSHDQKVSRTWLTEIEQSDWLAAVVKKLTDLATENNILKTTDNDLKHGLLSFRHLRNVLTHSRRY